MAFEASSMKMLLILTSILANCVNAGYYYHHGGNCYEYNSEYYLLVKEAKSYDDAKQYCKNRGGELHNPKDMWFSAHETRFVEWLADDTFGDEAQYWIGTDWWSSNGWRREDQAELDRAKPVSRDCSWEYNTLNIWKRAIRVCGMNFSGRSDDCKCLLSTSKYKQAEDCPDGWKDDRPFVCSHLMWCNFWG